MTQRHILACGGAMLGMALMALALANASPAGAAAGIGIALISLSLKGANPAQVRRARREERERRADSWRLRTGMRADKHQRDLRKKAEEKRRKRELRKSFFARFKEDAEEEQERQEKERERKQKQRILERTPGRSA